MSAFKDLTGTKIGRLTVTHRAENDANGVRWTCTCECGNTLTTSARNLHQNPRRKKTRSCGCLHRDIASATGKRRIRSASGVSATWIDEDF
jgi:hypothetical protein